LASSACRRSVPALDDPLCCAAADAYGGPDTPRSFFLPGRTPLEPIVAARRPVANHFVYFACGRCSYLFGAFQRRSQVHGLELATSFPHSYQSCGGDVGDQCSGVPDPGSPARGGPCCSAQAGDPRRCDLVFRAESRVPLVCSLASGARLEARRCTSAHSTAGCWASARCSAGRCRCPSADRPAHRSSARPRNARQSMKAPGYAQRFNRYESIAAECAGSPRPARGAAHGRPWTTIRPTCTALTHLGGVNHCLGYEPCPG